LKKEEKTMISTKYFTREEAEKTIPLVRQIVTDIINTAKEMRLVAEDIKGKVEEDPVIQKMAENINGYMKELEELGCVYKDWNFSIGLVDFPAIINGKEVYLCWRTDEDEILYYHDMDKSFSDRKLIPRK
jgi:hypothetical protein